MGVDLRGIDPGNLITSNFKLEISISAYFRGFRFDPSVGETTPINPNVAEWRYCMPIADLGRFINNNQLLPVPPARRFMKAFMPCVRSVPNSDFPYLAYPIQENGHALVQLPDPYRFIGNLGDTVVSKANATIAMLYFNDATKFDWADWYFTPEEGEAMKNDYLLINADYQGTLPVARHPIYGAIATI